MKEFKKQFTCLGENTKKYITFTVSIEKQVIKIDKNGEDSTKNISYILQFIDSARFVGSSLSNLVKNVSGKISRTKCKHRYDDKKYKTCEIKCKNWDCFLEYINFKDDLIECKCLCCNKSCQQKV